MKNSKRLVIALFALLLVFQLAACGKTPAAQTQAPAATAKATASAATAQPAPSVTEPEVKPTLKLLWPFRNGNEAQVPYFQELQDITGYPLELQFLSTDNPMQKLTLELASGTPYDLIKVTRGDFATISAQNVLTPLDDLLSEYGPNVLDATDTTEFWQTVTVDDKIMGVLAYKDRYSPLNAFIVRTDILAKHNLSMPTTIDEFTQLLTSLKTAEPDKIPLASVKLNQLDQIKGTFGIPVAWQEKNGELVPSVISEGNRDFLRYMKNLYDNGLLDPEFAAVTGVQKREKWSAEKCVVMAFNWGDWQYVRTLDQTNSAVTWDLTKALVGPTGLSGVEMSNYGPNANAFVIPITAEHPVDTMKWLNISCDYETAKLLRVGTEGKEFIANADGTFTATDQMIPSRGDAWYFTIGREDITAEYGDLILQTEDSYVKKTWQMLREASIDVAVPNAIALYQTPTAVASINSGLNALVEQWQIGFVMGDYNLDTQWDQFVKEWLAEGGQTCIDEYNAIYKNQK